MPVEVEDTGYEGIQKIILTNGTVCNGTLVEIYSYGATVNRWIVKDKNDQMVDVVLGYDSAEDLVTKFACYLGASVGRVGNRISNGKLVIDGKLHQLEINNHSNHLHGGSNTWAKKNWTVSAVDQTLNSVTLTYISPDGENGSVVGRLIDNIPDWLA